MIASSSCQKPREAVFWATPGSLGKGVGAAVSLLLFYGVPLFFLIGLFFGWTAKVAAWIQPWVQGLAGLALLIVVPLCLLLLLFRRTRAFGALGIYLASWPLGLALWIGCLLYAVAVSVFWTVAGILMAGLGIVPVAAIMTLVRRDWSSFGSIISAVVAVFALRWFGAWIAEKSEQWNAEAKIRADAFKERVTAKRANYFLRHWRGQFSLGVSYWLSGLVAGFLVGFATSTVGEIRKTISLRTVSALSLLLYALAIISTVWWCVGVCRSASNHFSRGGTRFWAGVAKVMVALSFLSTLVLTCTTYIPQSVELLSIIAGDAGMPPYQIRVLPGGTEIEFRGGLRAGSAKELERIFSAVPQAKVLHIESPGGRIREAQEMMELVRERRLTTYTSEYCVSAATLVLMSGKERVISANAKVGFHAGTFPGLTAEQRGAANDVVRATMQSAGVSEEFISQVLTTPPEQMWYPSFTEMLRNGVVTSQSYGERFAVSISGADLDAIIENLGVSPWFRTIREFEPEAYTKMTDDFATAIRSGKSEGEAIALAGQTAASIMKKYFAAASDEALLALLQDDWIALLRNYKDSNSRACIAALLGPDLGAADPKINVARAFPDWDSSTARIKERVMRSGASRMPVPINRRAASEDFGAIFDWLKARYGTEVQLLEEQRKWMDNSQKVCDMLLEMFERIAALPETQAANLVRNLLIGKSNNERQLGETAAPPTSVTYRVVNIKAGDVLNLRAGPGSNYPVVAVIPAETRGITLVDRRVANGTTMWQEVSVYGYTGWVNEVYLEVEPEIRKAKPVIDWSGLPDAVPP
jgi:hypothetical protein